MTRQPRQRAAMWVERRAAPSPGGKRPEQRVRPVIDRVGTEQSVKSRVPAEVPMRRWLRGAARLGSTRRPAGGHKGRVEILSILHHGERGHLHA